MLIIQILVIFLLTKLANQIKVTNFKLTQIDNAQNEYPIYFKCDFSVLNSNLSFIFQRQDMKRFNPNIYFKYESVNSNKTNFKANAILYPEIETFLKKSKKINLEIQMSVFKSNQLFLKLIYVKSIQCYKIFE